MNYKACVIWMHGLGADASNMEGLAAQLDLPTAAIRHVFLNAPMRAVTINNGMHMRAWYDIGGSTIMDREDALGIAASQKQIVTAIDDQVNLGFSTHTIFLAGFSQGGAMALFSGLNFDRKLAGIIALSAYLPLLKHCDAAADKTTPIFLAYGHLDAIVQPTWTKQSSDWLKNRGYVNITMHDYTMEHSICREELTDLSSWLQQQVQRVAR